MMRPGEKKIIPVIFFSLKLRSVKVSEEQRSVLRVICIAYTVSVLKIHLEQTEEFRPVYLLPNCHHPGKHRGEE